MTLLLAALAIGGVGAPDVSDYFPMVPGTKWYYEEDGPSGRLTLEARQPIEIDGKLATPIVTMVRKKVIDTRYYRIEGDTLYLVANDPEEPIAKPQPVLKVGDAKTSWRYDGKAQFGNDWAPLSYDATCVPKGKMTILGTERDCIELTMDAVLNGGAGIKIVSHQTTIYAKGIGWVEIRERRKIGKETTETVSKLVRFEPAK